MPASSGLRSPADAVMQAGLALSVRNLVSFGVMMSAVSRVGRYGAVPLATNEIMRQVFLFALTAMGALDVSVQALVAVRLGRVSLILAICCIHCLQNTQGLAELACISSFTWCLPF